MDELLARLPGLFAAHIRLALSALALATAIAVPLGLFVHRRARLREVVLGVVGVTQTIPSLALLAFMVPALAAVAPLLESGVGWKLSAIGFGPALAALTLYGLLPILQNTVTGLSGVEPATVEAARGVGMTDRQVLLRVELPLALPVIVAGLRTSTVWTVGTAVLATPVGASSLGDYIFVGLQTRNHASVAVGCAASAALALALDGAVRRVETALSVRVRAERRRRLRLPAAILILLVGAGIGPLGGGARAAARVGAKAFTEAYLFAEVIGQVFETAGLRVEQVGSLGSSVVFEALGSGDIDAYLDFSGTILAHYMNAPMPEAGPSAVLPKVRGWLRSEHDIRIAARLGYENRYAFAVPRARAERLGLVRLSDLAAVAGELSVAAGYEFFDRPEWASVQAAYGMAFASRRTMEHALAYEAVGSGEVDVVVAYSTDARLEAFDLVLLEDDRGAIPPYEALILVRGPFADAHPEAMARLSRLGGRFDEALVRRLNARIDEEGVSPLRVAQEALEGLD